MNTNNSNPVEMSLDGVLHVTNRAEDHEKEPNIMSSSALQDLYSPTSSVPDATTPIPPTFISPLGTNKQDERTPISTADNHDEVIQQHLSTTSEQCPRIYNEPQVYPPSDDPNGIIAGSYPVMVVERHVHHHGVVATPILSRPSPSQFDSAMRLGAIPHGKRVLPANEDTVEKTTIGLKRRRVDPTEQATAEQDTAEQDTTEQDTAEQDIEEDHSPWSLGFNGPKKSQIPTFLGCVTSSLDFPATLRARGNPFRPWDQPAPWLDPVEARPQAKHVIGVVAAIRSASLPRHHPKIVNPANDDEEERIDERFDNADSDHVPKQGDRIQTDDLELKKKEAKKKIETMRDKKPLEVDRFISIKDQAIATKFLAGKHDLLLVLSEHECRWLAKEYWIFTCEQLRFVLGCDGENKDILNKLQTKIALSLLINELSPSNHISKISPSTDDHISTHNGIPDTTESNSPDVCIDQENEMVLDVFPSAHVNEKPTLVEAKSNESKNIVLSGPEGESTSSTETAQRVNTAYNAKIDDKSMDILPLQAKFDSDILVSNNLSSIVARATASYQSNPSAVKKQLELIEEAHSAGHGTESACMPHTNEKLEYQAKSSVNINNDGEENFKIDKDSPRNPTTIQLEKALKLLISWKGALAQFYQRKGEANEGAEGHELPAYFPLDGPVDCLFPKSVLNFLETVRIRSLYSYFSLKKTESSSLIPEYRAWRSHCGLLSLRGFPLARHLAGINTRIEIALSSMPPVDAETQKWMGTVLVILTGCAKDFIVSECKINDAEIFVNGRTKEWSDRLVAWRAIHKMPLLKGSGKVAMISGWKTSLKESLDAEKGDGRVLTEEELMKDPPGDPTEILQPKIKVQLSRKAGKEFKAALYRDAEVALRSPDFLMSVLKSDNAVFLSSVGISTAEQLIDVEKQIDSDITLSLVKFRSEDKDVPANANTCVRLLYDWTQRVRAKLEELQTVASKDLVKKRGSKSKPMNGTTETKRNIGPNTQLIVAADFKQKVEVKLTKEKKRGKKNLEKRVRHVLVRDNPMDTLSVSARKFLETTKIKTAHDFLATKTTETAFAYGFWREREGMPLLKGYGSIATISSWKAQIRKVAKALGDEELAATLPIGQQSKGVNEEDILTLTPKVVVPGASRDVSIMNEKVRKIELIQPTPWSHKDVIMGLQFRLFSVHNASDPSLIYDFELSVRRSEDSVSQLSVFLTFLGAKNASSPEGGSTVPHRPVWTREGYAIVLKEKRSTKCGTSFTLRSAGTFSSCDHGSGLIDLATYGVGPLSKEIDRVREMKGILRAFVIPDKILPSLELKDCCVQSDSNVLRRGTTSGPQFLFYAKDKMERGQVVELRYSKFDNSKSFPIENEGDMRRYLVRAISSLSFVDLIRLYHVLSPIHKKIEQDTLEDDTPKSEAAKFISRRRVHWVALKMLLQIEEVAQRSVSITMEDRKKQFDPLKRDVEALLMDSIFRDKILESSLPKMFPMFRPFQDEVINEILALVDENTTIVRPLDSRLWCKLARDLMFRATRLVATYFLLTKTDTREAQTALCTELCNSTVEAARLFSSKERTFDEFAFDALDDELLEGEGFEQTQAVVALEGIEANSTVFVSVYSAKTGDTDLNMGWYAEHQILSVLAAVAECGLITWIQDEDGPIYNRSTILSTVYATIEKSELLYDESAIGLGKYFIDNRIDAVGAVQLVPGFVERNTLIMPSALPLFLGTVWPKLRAYGWHMDANIESVGEVSFIPPGQKTRLKRANDRSRRVRDERDRKRIKTEQRLTSVGLGNLAKRTKRLLIQSVGEDEGLESQISVREILEMFLKDAMSISSENKDDQRRRVKLLVDGIITCFDELYPLMSDTAINRGEEIEGAITYSHAKGAHKLIQLLMVLPNIFHQSGLNLRQIEDAGLAIKDLVRFLSVNQAELFDESFQPVHEEYTIDEGLSTRLLAGKVACLASSKDGNPHSNDCNGSIIDNAKETLVESEIIRDLVLPDDEEHLTSFQSLALKQMLPCRFGANDKRKKKCVAIGYPGIVCRHCLAANGEGKYFFSSLESLGTAGGVAWSHLVRCSKLPADTKETLIAKRAKHSDDRKTLKQGAMSIYFARLWQRLHSSNTVGFSGFTVTHAAEEVLCSPHGATEVGQSAEFGSHLEVLRYLQGDDAPMSLQAEMEEPIEMYYRCLKQGGMIYETNVMPRAPRKFSSEYLLSMMAPGIKSSLKRHTSMG